MQLELYIWKAVHYQNTAQQSWTIEDTQLQAAKKKYFEFKKLERS